MTSSTTCIVTGGAGFIGCKISAALADRYERVIVIDNLHPQVHADRTRPEALHPRAELVIADVTDAVAWDQLLAPLNSATVIHLAAETGTGQSLTEASRHAQVNVLGTTVMLDAFSRRDLLPERIVLTSSRAVYGEGPWMTADASIVYPGQRTRSQLAEGLWQRPGMTPLPANARTTHPMPVSIYGATKLAQENILMSWCNSFGVSHVILRLQNVYGPGQSLSNPYVGIVSLFCRLAREGRSIPLYEDGTMLRDFVFIEDVARAVISSLDLSPQSQPIDIGSGSPMTLGEAGTFIADLYGAPPPTLCGKYRFGDVRHASCVIDDSVNLFGTRPAWLPERGLKALSDWIEEQLPPVAPRV